MKKNKKKDIDWLTKRPIAHRGYHGTDLNGIYFPENSMSSFKRALKYNYSIEFDLQLSKDKKVVVFHDSDLNRVCNVNKKICDLTMNEISELRLFNSDEQIPLFTDVLKEINGNTPLVIELKASLIPGELEKNVYEILKSYDGLFSVQSFQPATILWFKGMGVKYPLGLIGGNEKVNLKSFESILTEYFGYVTVVVPDYVAYQYSKYIKYKWLKYFGKLLQIPIIVWTVKLKSEQADLKKYADNIIFEQFEA